MNKTKIDWADTSWNPVTGCLHDCKYCYARSIAKRFGGFDAVEMHSHRDIEAEGQTIHEFDAVAWTLGKAGGTPRKAPYPFGFEPTLHRYRLEEPARKKRQRNIFVGSMTDLFGEWVPVEWIKAVFDACRAAPQHNYLFLTKNPARYERLRPFESENWWFGTSVTCAEEKRRIQYLPFRTELNRANTFLSIEPLTGSLGELPLDGVDWVIIGAMTGPGSEKHQPERAWVEEIVEQCDEYAINVFMKSSLADIWGEPLIQELPLELKREART